MTIYSAQSGDWFDSYTWDGGNVPDPYYDDVVIGSGHSVYANSSFNNFASGRYLTVESGASLSLGASVGFDSGSSLDISGSLDVQSGYYLYFFGYLNIQSGGSLNVYGYCYFEGDGKSIYGSLYVGSSAYAYLQYGCTMNVYGSLYLDWSSSLFLYS